jgi:hypothetical protein
MRKAGVVSLLLAAASGVALVLWAAQRRTGVASADVRVGARLFEAASLGATAIVLLAAPLFTVDGRSRHSRLALAAVVAGWVASFTLSTLLVRAVLGGFSLAQVASVSLLVAVFAILALGLGRFAAVVSEDELSAAFWSYVFLAVLAAGPVLFGPWIQQASAGETAIEALLLVSPLVAAGTASGLDVMRTETLYRWTPIGQRRFQYPHWSSSLAFSLTLSGLLFGGARFSKEPRTCVV